MIALDGEPVFYRDVLITPRLRSMTGCERICRPDGSWRYSEPTITEFDSVVEWIITKPSGLEIGSSSSYKEARRIVDEMYQSRQLIPGS